MGMLGRPGGAVGGCREERAAGEGGMPREYIKELRGDTRGETIDIYDHIDMEELRAAYMECVPKLGL